VSHLTLRALHVRQPDLERRFGSFVCITTQFSPLGTESEFNESVGKWCQSNLIGRVIASENGVSPPLLAKSPIVSQVIADIRIPSLPSYTSMAIQLCFEGLMKDSNALKRGFCA
jgi:hypothetical protein